MHPRSALAALVALSLAASTHRADARAARTWTYADLAAKADLVVIATPSKTTATKTQEALPDISQNNGPMMATRVATELKVVTALKGRAGATIVLHHDALPDAGAMVNGPMLVTFDGKAHVQYLMFLVKDRDGEYVPVSGQTDPVWAIEPLHQPFE